jgi:hypothetical protein
MAYLVSITPRAERDFASLFQDINAGESDAALKWYGCVATYGLLVGDVKESRNDNPTRDLQMATDRT